MPARLLRRNPNSHKGDFGRVFILAASKGMTGAGILCAKAAMRAGAGLVTLGIPKTQYPIVAKRLLEAMTAPLEDTGDGCLALKALSRVRDFLKRTDVLVIGPGLSRHKQTQQLIRKVIAEFNGSMVVDADAINALAGHLDLLSVLKSPRSVMLTPHPGEFSRLARMSAAKLRKDRKISARSFAKKYKIVLVLKGHNSVVCGEGRCYINRTGNPGMATAGSGDVLSGMAAAFLAQGLDTFEAAKTAVYLHGLAGDLAAREKTQISLIASDIIEKIPEAVKQSVKRKAKSAKVKCKI
ncbi:MAG: NAD(P)H-hydrate dehydratase [Candidatus Omnitrophica bacterium]|nr:NAD(P)H-hydrate dehydratase [Candidatus Omnitrophota bacterium]